MLTSTQNQQGYGIYIPGGTFTPPLEETLADHLPEDYAKTVAYPWIRKALTEASAGRGWTWTEICPDAVVGFSPNGSAFSLALHWAQYLSLYAHSQGAGAEVVFPGSAQGADALFSPVSGPILGRLAVYAALHPDRCGARILNVADADAPTTFRSLWPAIAAWFGLVGRVDDLLGGGVLKPGEYVAAHKHVFEEKGLGRALTCGVGAGTAQLDGLGWWLSFDRQLSLERLRSTGFTEARAPIDGWIEAFEALRAAGIIM
jgi:hypothetical protein